MKAGTTYSAIIGQTVKELRKESDLSQGQMAEKMGLTQAAWSKLETGKSVMSMAQVAKAADILNVQASEIVKVADQAVKKLEADSIPVKYDEKEAANAGLMLLGIAAVGVLVAGLLLRKK